MSPRRCSCDLQSGNQFLSMWSVWHRGPAGCCCLLGQAASATRRSISGGVRRKCGREVSPHGPAGAPTARGGGSPPQTCLAAGAVAEGRARSGPVNSAQRSFHRPRSQPHQSPGAQWVGAFLTSVSSHSHPIPPMGSSLQAFGSPTPTLHVTGTKEAGHTALPEPRGIPHS